VLNITRLALSTLQAVRGMHDILPEDMPYWARLEQTLRDLFDAYGYSEVRLPIVEKTELFLRSIGEVTDIVEKEMYSFDDRNGESLTLRPEGTAGSVRAGIEHGLVQPQQTHKWWYSGPMFRHERPQKGRYRQFHQVGIEVFGLEGPDIDVELILLTRRLWQMLGLSTVVQLEINTLGSPESRHTFRQLLVDYFSAHRDRLDEDSLRRLERNPLRILDSKNPDLKDLIEGAPRLHDSLDDESRAHFAQLQAMLAGAGVAFVVNPHLVRGLDYYNRTVFEWKTDRLGAQAAVAAGGRYDGLVAQLGGKSVPAIGCAFGMERVVALLQDLGVAPAVAQVDVYVVLAGDAAVRVGFQLTEAWRDAVPGLRMVVNCGGGSFKAQFRRADRSHARWAVILGEDEVQKQVITLKPLREQGEQRQVAWMMVGATLKSLCG